MKIYFYSGPIVQRLMTVAKTGLQIGNDR